MGTERNSTKADALVSSPKGNNNMPLYRYMRENEIFVCSVCNYQTKDQSNANLHIKYERRKAKRPNVFDCMSCDFKSKWKSNLLKHVDSIHLKIPKAKPKRPNVFDCTSCDYKSKWKGNLLRHVDVTHLNVPKIKNKTCYFPDCNFKTALSHDLRLHLKAVHFKVKDFGCPYCNFISSYKFHVLDHVNAVHEKKKNNKCSICGFLTYNKEGLKKHMIRRHANCRCHVCDFCLRYSSDDFAKLRRHMKLRHSFQYYATQSPSKKRGRTKRNKRYNINISRQNGDQVRKEIYAHETQVQVETELIQKCPTTSQRIQLEDRTLDHVVEDSVVPQNYLISEFQEPLPTSQRSQLEDRTVNHVVEDNVGPQNYPIPEGQEPLSTNEEDFVCPVIECDHPSKSLSSLNIHYQSVHRITDV